MIDFLRSNYDMDFYLAAIPVQVLFLVYYMRKRKLPLKDTMYFTNLMYFNLAAMIAGILRQPRVQDGKRLGSGHIWLERGLPSLRSSGGL